MLAITAVMSISFCLMLVEANVEKTIFLAPIPIHASPKDYSSLYGLHLGTLTPSKPSLQTRLTAVFPSEKNGISGFDSWFLLDELESQRRYEVRICWSATQPTSFNIWTHHFDAVVDTSKLNNSLWSFGRIWQNQGEQHLSSLGTVDKSPVIANSQFHGLLLQISAAADYYTTNKKLMKDVPPVKVDIILDPYILNILPKSLVPTTGYLVAIAVASWYISSAIWWWLDQVSHATPFDTSDTVSKKRD